MIKIYSDKTKQYYDTCKEAESAEKKYDLEKAEKEKKIEEYNKQQKELKDARGSRAQEVEDARKKYEELLNKFARDYGSYHTKITFDPFSFWDNFFRF